MNKVSGTFVYGVCTCMYMYMCAYAHNVNEEVFTGRSYQLTVVVEAQRTNWPTVHRERRHIFDQYTGSTEEHVTLIIRTCTLLCNYNDKTKIQLLINSL